MLVKTNYDSNIEDEMAFVKWEFARHIIEVPACHPERSEG
jgi:hypothetical protein